MRDLAETLISGPPKLRTIPRTNERTVIINYCTLEYSTVSHDHGISDNEQQLIINNLLLHLSACLDW
jgi:hypothetical protein